MHSTVSSLLARAVLLYNKWCIIVVYPEKSSRYYYHILLAKANAVTEARNGIHWVVAHRPSRYAYLRVYLLCY